MGWIAQGVSNQWYRIYGAFTIFFLSRQIEKAKRSASRPVTRTGRLLYVAASALPYHISGYTTRTHAVIKAFGSTGVEVQPLTRSGYPWDRPDAKKKPGQDHTQTLVQGVSYQHRLGPANNRPVPMYAVQAAAPIREAALAHAACAIQAASNHVNALPALLAARQLGLPFHYEMRGLWELTRASRFAGFDRTEQFRLGLSLERFVAQEADKVLVISEQLSAYIQQRWGISKEKISLLPNCVDPANIVPADASQVIPYTIGYAGSLIAYEGLDTLIDAIGVLRDANVPVTVNVIGDGEVRAKLMEHVARMKLEDRIHFHGKVAPEVARDILGKSALVCIPRKPFKVCEIIPPIKLVEALAMEKPVIVPDLPVFRDEMGTQPPGWFFKAGDAQDLAVVIRTAFAQSDTFAAIGKQARDYVVRQRNWKTYISQILPGIQQRD